MTNETAGVHTLEAADQAGSPTCLPSGAYRERAACCSELRSEFWSRCHKGGQCFGLRPLEGLAHLVIAQSQRQPPKVVL